nr:phosphoadenosine phosphosulfate reductase family protein [Pseudomonas caspiana]
MARDQAAAAGLPFIVAKAAKTLLEMVERRFESRPEVPSWPSASTRQCTSDLKRGPIQREVRRYAKANGFKTIVNCLGLRAQESPGRAKRAVFSRMGISNSVLTWYEWLPIHDMRTTEVFAAIEVAGQEPHYAYALGNDRLSCVFMYRNFNNS